MLEVVSCIQLTSIEIFTMSMNYPEIDFLIVSHCVRLKNIQLPTRLPILLIFKYFTKVLRGTLLTFL